MNTTSTVISGPKGNAVEAAPIVYIVDDDVSVRESLELLLESAGWQTETFTCATEFLARQRASCPICLVLDVSLPDMNGLDLLQRLTAQGAEMSVVMVSGLGDVPMTVRAMKAGAIDFVTKPVNADALIAVITHAIELSRTARQERAALRVIQERHASLTCREQQVMERVVAGRLNKQVAFELGISEITVKAHRGQMVKKMKARSLPDLVRMASRLCLAA